MCGGVISGFAGVKFSGSPRRFGVSKEISNKVKSISRKPKMSLYEKYG